MTAQEQTILLFLGIGLLLAVATVAGEVLARRERHAADPVILR
jgi:hypothetical protein